MEEIWKDIEEYEGLYQVSNLGRVKSLNYNHGKKEKILRNYKDTSHYLQIRLWKDGKGKQFLVHRLVANAFIPNPNGYKEVNHKDENKENSCADNLEWCDRKYNVNYGSRNEKMAITLTNRKDQSKTVLQYDIKGNFLREWNSTQECGRNGFSFSNVAKCCRGKRKSAYGYLWKYKSGVQN